jgi:hypothetical protein
MEIETRLAAQTLDVAPCVAERPDLSGGTAAHGTIDFPVHFNHSVAHSARERAEQLALINVQFLC